MRHRGVVLVAVLVVAVLVAVIAAGLMFRVRAEAGASAATFRGEQAYNASMSGLARAVAVLRAAALQKAVDPKVWSDQPDLFQNQLVADDGAQQWYFTVYADDPSQPAGVVRYGLADEASKVNLNSADQATLLALPNMTSELVDCLMDYRDADSGTRPDGAEQDYYDRLPQPYVIANGPLSTLEELFLVKGFNARIIYGEDANLNGLLDPNENDGDDSFPPDDRDGHLDRGLRGVATVWSTEPNTDSEGRQRIDLAAAAPTDLGLPDQTVEFIRLYLGEGGKFKDPSDLLEMRYQLKQDAKEPSDLKARAWIESGVGAVELPVVMDRLTTRPPASPVVGLVNVNTAPAEVLAAMPGMDAGLAQRIVEARRDLDAETRATIAWLYTQNLVDAAAFKAIAPYLTTRSLQFTVRCVGFGVPCGRYRVIEAVVDFSGAAPRIAYLRDISRLGLPFALDVNSMQRSQSQ